MCAQLLPFYNLNGDELQSLFSNRDSEINLSDVAYYFDPNCLSDSYNRNIDPDIGGSANFLNENVYSKYHDYHDLSQLLQNPNASNVFLKIISQKIRCSIKTLKNRRIMISPKFFLYIIALNKTKLTDDVLQLHRIFQNSSGILTYSIVVTL